MAHNDDFDTAGAYVAVKDLLDELVLFTPAEYVEEVTTDFGTKDAVITDIVVLSQPGQPTYDAVMIFQGSLIGQLKRKVPTVNPQTGQVIKEGRKVLGVIGKGDAKKGQNAPYILVAPDDDQKQVARDYLAGRTIADATEPEADGGDPFAVKK